MRGKSLKYVLFLIALLALAAAGCGGGDEAGGTETGTTAGGEGGTLVFGSSADPVVLDFALISDGE
jgi:peptide/nickel transport system substrate-binding protein